LSDVRLEGITKVFGNSVAVAKMDLHIQDGEFLVLVGSSGCGKSTTLRMIAGLEKPSSGEIYIGPKKVTNLEPKDRDIAMVFQSYALYPHKKVFDNLAFGLQLKKKPKNEIKEIVTEVAEMLEIGSYLERYPKELSGGQRQRVALGRAIVRHPSVFLMDEPLSNLDAKLRAQTRAELIKLHERLKTTVVYVTHDQTEAMTMGKRIAVMQGGVIQQIGTPAEVYKTPTNLFVAGFIGMPPMNFFEGEVQLENGRVTFQGKGIYYQLPGSAQGVQNGQKVILGIRAECLNLVAESGISGIVEVVEHIGSEAIIHATTPGKEKLVIKMNGYQEAPATGSAIKVNPCQGNAHLFDAGTGNTIYTAGVV